MWKPFWIPDYTLGNDSIGHLKAELCPIVTVCQRKSSLSGSFRIPLALGLFLPGSALTGLVITPVQNKHRLR